MKKLKIFLFPFFIIINTVFFYNNKAHFIIIKCKTPDLASVQGKFTGRKNKKYQIDPNMLPESCRA